MPEYFAPKHLSLRLKEYATASNHPLFGDFMKKYEEERANEALNLSDDEDEEKEDDLVI